MRIHLVNPSGVSFGTAVITPSARWARWLARFARRLFASAPMPALREPRRVTTRSSKRVPIVSVS